MSNSVLHVEGVELQEWANAHEPKDGMLWKRGYWDQITFVRDTLPQVFFKTYTQFKANPVRVVGDHTSKSIDLPVYSIKVGDLEIRMRYNFYDWQVSVRSEKSIPDTFFSLINKDEVIHNVYFEGFERNWIFGSYNQNPQEFSVEIGDEYKLYAFMRIVSGSLGILV